MTKTMLPEMVDGFRCISHRWTSSEHTDGSRYVSVWENAGREVITIEYSDNVNAMRIPVVLRQMVERHHTSAVLTPDEVVFDALEANAGSRNIDLR